MSRPFHNFAEEDNQESRLVKSTPEFDITFHDLFEADLVMDQSHLSENFTVSANDVQDVLVDYSFTKQGCERSVSGIPDPLLLNIAPTFNQPLTDSLVPLPSFEMLSDGPTNPPQLSLWTLDSESDFSINATALFNNASACAMRQRTRADSIGLVTEVNPGAHEGPDGWQESLFPTFHVPPGQTLFVQTENLTPNGFTSLTVPLSGIVPNAVSLPARLTKEIPVAAELLTNFDRGSHFETLNYSQESLTVLHDTECQQLVHNTAQHTLAHNDINSTLVPNPFTPQRDYTDMNIVRVTLPTESSTAKENGVSDSEQQQLGRKRRYCSFLDGAHALLEDGQTSIQSTEIIRTAKAGLGHAVCVGNVDGGQCVYSSRNEPCQLCFDRGIKEPCIKITSAEFNVSRALPEANSGRECHEEQALLDFAYSDKSYSTYPELYTYIRQWGILFGKVPRNSPLLQAVLAAAARYHPEPRSNERFKYHNALALRTLQRRTSRPADIVEADLFAACTLLLTVTSEELPLLARCCLFIFQQVAETANTDAFAVFGPFIIQMLFNAYLYCPHSKLPKLAVDLLNRYAHFDRTVRYCSEFKSLGSIPEAWQSPIVEAAFCEVSQTVSALYKLHKSIVLEGVRNPEFEETLEALQTWTTRRLNAPDFQKALTLLLNLYNTPDGSPAERELAAYTLQGNKIIDFLFQLLKKDCSPAVQRSAGKAIIYSCLLIEEQFALNRFPVQYYSQVVDLRRYSLVLGGCTLLDEVSQSVRPCVLAALKAMKRSDLGLELEGYWQGESQEKLAFLLEQSESQREEECSLWERS